MRSLGSLALPLGASALVAFAAGCVADAGGEASRSSDEAVTLHPMTSLPADPNWEVGPAPDCCDDTFTVAVRSGYSFNACRTLYAGSIQIGWAELGLSPSCNFSYGGSAKTGTDFQVLKADWIPASNGAIPAGALAQGDERAVPPNIAGTPIYSCRATFAGSVQVGKIEQGWPGCDIAYGGQEHSVSSYAVLGSASSALSFSLVPVAANGPVPDSAIFGGIDSDRWALFPCVVPYGGGMQVGKINLTWTACDIGWGGGEISVSNTPYSLLEPTLTPSNVPVTAYQAGTDTDGQPLGVCVVPVAGGSAIGKYLFSSRSCS